MKSKKPMKTKKHTSSLKKKRVVLHEKMVVRNVRDLLDLMEHLHDDLETLDGRMSILEITSNLDAMIPPADIKEFSCYT
jgi:hypothetical protein